MTPETYRSMRQALLSEGCQGLISLEEESTKVLATNLLKIALEIKKDFDRAAELMPFWSRYAPIQRGHKPRGEAFPWGEVGEKVLEGHLYSLAPRIFQNVQFTGLPYGHDIRFMTDRAFIHIDVKSTGPTDNADEVVSSPNQVTGTGRLGEDNCVYNDIVEIKGARSASQFLPELAPFYIIDEQVFPTLTFYLKLVYSVRSLGNQPLEYVELICVPNGLMLFDGPNLNQKVKSLLTPGKDELKVIRKRTRIKLTPLAQLSPWRCQQIRFDAAEPYIEFRAGNQTA